MGWWIGPCAKITSCPACLVYKKRAPAASYVPAVLTANSPFIMYEPLDIFNAVNVLFIFSCYYQKRTINWTDLKLFIDWNTWKTIDISKMKQII